MEKVGRKKKNICFEANKHTVLAKMLFFLTPPPLKSWKKIAVFVFVNINTEVCRNSLIQIQFCVCNPPTPQIIKKKKRFLSLFL